MRKCFSRILSCSSRCCRSLNPARYSTNAGVGSMMRLLFLPRYSMYLLVLATISSWPAVAKQRTPQMTGEVSRQITTTLQTGVCERIRPHPHCPNGPWQTRPTPGTLGSHLTVGNQECDWL